MARALTTDEKKVQRLPGQWSQFFLVGAFGSTPYNVVYTAQLGTPPTTNDDLISIPFVSGIGTLANVKPDMRLDVGSTAGENDLGVCRIRKTPISGTLYVGEVSDVNWLAGGTIYLTVVDDFGLWEKQLKVIGSTFYMDGDIAYSDQFANFDPVPVLGSHRVGIIPSGSSTIQVQLGPESGTASQVFGSTITSHTWTATGPASVTFDNANAVNPKATFSQYGKYCLYDSVLAANGKTFVGVRYVFIYDSTHPPLGGIQVTDFECTDYSRGCWSAKVTIPGIQGQNYSVSNFPPRTLMGLISKDFAMVNGATGTPQALPVISMPGAENIRLWGWIEDETLLLHMETGDIEFVIQGPGYWMQQVTGFTEGLEFVTSSSSWVDMPYLTVDRALWVLFHWRSTLDRICDFIPTGDTRYLEAIDNGSSKSLWGQAQDFLNATIGGNIGSDRYGRVFAMYEPQLVAVASRSSISVVTDLFEQDMFDLNWMNSEVQTIGLLSLSGVTVNSAGTAAPLYSLSPGHVYKRFGADTPSDKWLLDTQANANALAGLYTGWKNNLLQNIQCKIGTFIPALDMFPNQYVNIDISSRDPRGVGYSGSAIIRSMKIIPDSKKTGAVTMELTLEAVSLPELSVNGDVPGSSTAPPLPGLPPLPPPPAPVATPAGPPTNLVMLVAPVVSGPSTIVYSLDGGITWVDMVDGIDARDLASGAVIDFVVSPVSGYCFLLVDGLDTGTNSSVYCAKGLGASWTLILSIPQATELIGLDPSLWNCSPKAIGINMGAPDEVCALIGIITGANQLMYWCKGSSSGFPTRGVQAVNNYSNLFVGASRYIANIVYGNNRWLACSITSNGNPKQWIWSDRNAVTAGKSATTVGTWLDNASGPPFTVRGAKDGASAFANGISYGIDIGVISKTTDNGATDSEIDKHPIPLPSLAASPDALVLMGGDPSGSSTQAVVSSDGGATWGSIGIVANFVAFWCYGTNLMWVAQGMVSGAEIVAYSLDGGVTWFNITGNLPALFGSPTGWYASRIRAW